ncbi:MAG: acyl-CoA dehydrogenase family protein [Acidimicrobiia bacterium]|nr:acyl-CoA dehydrogenase family protein [Acidimicrobiia bacterium]
MIEELSPEQLEVQAWAREFAERYIAPKALELDKDPDSPLRDELLREAAKAGVMGIAVPEALGGSATDIFAGTLVTEELAAACAGCAVLIGAASLGLTPILLSGNFPLISRFLPEITESWNAGEPKLVSLAANEPDTGSDFISGHPAGRMATRIEPEDGGYRVNGRKVFISNGSIASYISVFGMCDPTKPIREGGVCVLMPADAPGFAVGQIFDKMGQRASPAVELVFDDVWVPEENRICPEGFGWQLNRIIMSVTRPVVGAIALGIARAAYERALEYAEVRVQGGKPIVEHQAIQIMLADMATRVEAARGLVYRAARSVAAGQPDIKVSSMAKAFASDAAVANATDAIQVLGGNGYMHEYGVEKLLRDAKLTQIYEGTNQINRFEIMESVAAERSS